jgi:hypothetical protein
MSVIRTPPVAAISLTTHVLRIGGFGSIPGCRRASPARIPRLSEWLRDPETTREALPSSPAFPFTSPSLRRSHFPARERFSIELSASARFAHRGSPRRFGAANQTPLHPSPVRSTKKPNQALQPTAGLAVIELCSDSTAAGSAPVTRSAQSSTPRASHASCLLLLPAWRLPSHPAVAELGR